MTYKEFATWLEGVLDFNESGLSADQVAKIKERLGSLTYPKDVPSIGPGINPPKMRC